LKAAVCRRYGPPEVLHVEQVEKPAPGKKDLLVRVRASAVTSSDWIVRSGATGNLAYQILARLALGLRGPRQPILGMILAGEVEAVGDGATSYKPGDRVYAMTMLRFGAYGQYACVAEASLVAPMPPSLSYTDAVSIPYGGLLALHFLRKGDIERRRRVLIYGASGAVGTSAIQLAKWFGAEVTGVCSGRNIELVKSLGADKAIDYEKDDVVAGSEIYDLIFVAVGNRVSPPSRSAFGRILAPDGAYVFVDQGTPKLRVEDLALLTELAEAGHIKPVVDRTYSLDEIAEAQRYVQTEHKRGNVVITID
jgi:NADPH:quinone reductase-like Zn-dependent oxidoreductase